MIRYTNASTQRWYAISLDRDLFHGVVLVLSWGSLRSAHGNSATLFPAPQELRTVIRVQQKRRRRHGYKRIPCCHKGDD